MRTAVETAQAWYAAVNAGLVADAVALCHPEVEVRGPRGTGHGHDLMRGWLTRSGIRLVPQDELQARALPGADGPREQVTTACLAVWTADNVPFGAPSEPVATWVRLVVCDGVLVSVARFESEAELSAEDQPPAAEPAAE